MRIVSFQISGFKGYEHPTTINFVDENGKLIFDTEGEERTFIFEAILGIIFGFTQEEKKRFRGDRTINQTFTGLVTLALDQKTVLIERDFETDIIACLLSDNLSSRPIFQGKDIVDNGYSRPYLDMLRSIFPIVDKSLYLEILKDEINEGNSLSGLLHSLYLLFSPRFNLNKVRFLISKSESLMANIDTSKLNSKNIEQLEQFKEGLIFIKNLQSFRQELKGDLEKLLQLLNKIRHQDIQKGSLLSQLEESYKALIDFNPILLRAEVLLWKSLIQIKEKNQKELKALRQRLNEIEQTLQMELAEYNQLPESINKEISKYEENLTKSEKLKEKIRKIDTDIQLNEVKYNTWRNFKIFFVAFVTPISFGLSYVAFNSWFLIIPEAFFFFLIFFFLFGHYHSKIKEKLDNLQEDKDILQKRLYDTQKAIERLGKKWYFLKDPETFKAHKDRLLEYQDLQQQLKQLRRKEQRILQVLNQPSSQRQLEAFKQKYGSLIDISRPDLEEYLDTFVELKNRLSSIESSSVDPPVVQELQKIIQDYRQAIGQLKAAEEHFSERLQLHQYNLPIEQILDAVNRRIKNLQMRQGIQFEY